MRSSGRGSGSAPRLLFVVNDFGFFLSHRLAVGEAAREAGFSVTVAAARGTGGEEVADRGFSVRSLPLDPHGTNPAVELRSLAGLHRLYRDVAPDIAHLVTIKPVLYGGIAARTARLPAVVSAISGLGYLFIGADRRSRRLAGVVRPLYRAALRHPRQRIIFQNEHDRAVIARLGVPLEDRAELIGGSGVDLEEFRPGPEPEGPITFVLPARLLREKGVGEFVEAAQMLRRAGVAARFIAVGARPEGNPAAVPAETLAEWRAEGIVEFPGHVRDMPAVYKAAHVVVLPSYREGFPRVLMEAAASARAVITTDVPGCRDAVIAGETALLVPPRDPAALAAAMRRLIEDADLRRRLGAAGRRLAEARFGIEGIVARHLAIYEDLMREAGRG